MSTMEVEAALRSADEGLPHWTSAKIVRQHDSRKPWPSAIDLRDDQLPAIIYNWTRRQGTLARQGPLEPTSRELIASVLDPGTFPYDIAEMYSDEHQPQMELLLIAKPDALYGKAIVTVQSVTGTFLPGERIDQGDAVQAFINVVNTAGTPKTLEVFEVYPRYYTEFGDLLTFTAGATVTGKDSGATAQVVSTVAEFESLADLEQETRQWLRIHGVHRLRDAGAEFEEIFPVPDLSGFIGTKSAAYAMSRMQVRFKMISRIGVVRRTIEKIHITGRIKDIDGVTLLTQQSEVPSADYVEGQ